MAYHTVPVSLAEKPSETMLFLFRLPAYLLVKELPVLPIDRVLAVGADLAALVHDLAAHHTAVYIKIGPAQAARLLFEWVYRIQKFFSKPSLCGTEGFEKTGAEAPCLQEGNGANG